ncbi:MAG: GSCFA domain-containing protein [Bacteroidales bacterium]|nr:GSCFA domain-containing protein [Bacteroidales bacterium]
MEFTTRVNIEPAVQKISYSNRILMIGSCFANEIGEKLKECGFDISVNPFGTLYNPVSISKSLALLGSTKQFKECDVIDISRHSTTFAVDLQQSMKEIGSDAHNRANPGRYCSFYHHSSFAKENASEFLKKANERLELEQKFFTEADTVIITLGTSWVYRHKSLDTIVSNCHKIHPDEFNREFLEWNKTAQILNDIVDSHPDKRFIFTVSPIRHLKDGAHGNAISKASLLLAVESLLDSHSNADYFPAYEIVLDELRDYRFYAEDMVHPTAVAVKYIFERFRESFISAECLQKMAEMAKISRRRAHIPIGK